ncbi:hypothetical protein NBRC116188_24500 [Oceaniserpentilla sp. 4NH20-0058]|uniref:Spy/CpxP family protein refolding chaperone n=1 Tax=Oceaniserpentilla sp. 4NH20-0058 TaxID=3127660 RepID=UPI003103CA52
MKIKQPVIQLLSVLSLLLIFGMNANAFEGKMGKRFVKELDLTPAQQKKVESIKQSQMDNRAENKEKFKALKKKKRELLANYSDSKAKEIAEESSKLHKEKMIKRLKTQNEIYQILDDRQKILYQAMLEKKSNHKGKGKHGKRHEKGGHKPKNHSH